MLVLALVAALGLASGAHAFSAKPALRASSDSAREASGDLARNAAEGVGKIGISVRRAHRSISFNRFRYYDPEAGQYVAQDPIGLAGGLGLHAYVHDPLAWVDPWGLTQRQSCDGRVPHRRKPRVEDGNLKEGWEHIDARHVSGTHPDGPGDLFAAATTRAQVTDAVEEVVAKGTRKSDPSKRIQTFEKRTKVNGRRDRVRVIVDSDDGNRVISAFPVLSE
jgi:RHS repeat-associated protein